MRRKIIAAAITALALPVVLAPAASGHGYTQNPPSRSYNCKLGVAQNCGAIQYEPQSVEGPKNFPSAGPADGSLCSAGHGEFAELDDPRGGGWPKAALRSGQSYEFVWTLTAAHATSSFRYFVTRNGWNPSAPLTRAQLESTPFLTVDFGGARPPFTVRHTGTLPSGKSGHHVIYGVWDIADTANAFYSCADVNFS